MRIVFWYVLCGPMREGGSWFLNMTDSMPLRALQLLIKHKANVNALNTIGSSPLHIASFSGHLTCVQVCLPPLCQLVTDIRPQILISAGTLCERDRNNKGRFTPLAYAIMYNHSNVAEYLLHSGEKMVNVHENIGVPVWMTQFVTKRKRVIHSTLILKGVLKKRFKVVGAEAAYLNGRIPKDMINLVGLHVWFTRLDPKWNESSRTDSKRMKK